MIGRRTVIGLSLLTALLLSACAAQSAAADIVTTSNNTTAFTCVKGTPETEDFEDAHCDKTHPTKHGEYEHTLIPLNTKTAVDGKNEEVTDSTKKSEPAVLTGEIGLAKVEIECSVVKNNTANSWIENKEPKVGEHTVSGTIETEFSVCNVKKINKCVVHEPIVVKANVHGVEGFPGPNGEAGAMGLLFSGDGEEEAFTTIEFTNKGVEACSLNKQKFKIQGRAIGTGGPATNSAQNNKESGATLMFNEKAQTLKLGPKSASFNGLITPTMTKGGSPISLTTTT